MLRYIVYYIGAIYIYMFKYRFKKNLDKILEEDKRMCLLSGVIILETFLIFKILQSVYSREITILSAIVIITIMLSVTFFILKED